MNTNRKWKKIVARGTGTSHSKWGKPCQDYGNYIEKKDIIIGAVSDGAGSAQHSEEGSKLAVETEIDYLKRNYDHSSSLENLLWDSFNQTTEKIREKAKEKKYELKDLSCTLLVFIATPHDIAAMQVGDGFIVVRFDDEEDFRLLFDPQKGEYANETIFITSHVQPKIDTWLQKPKFIFASSDGLERVALEKQNQPVKGFFSHFEKSFCKGRDLDEEKKDIEEWINGEEVNKRTDDDKTIVVCYLDEPNNPESQKTPPTQATTPREITEERTNNHKFQRPPKNEKRPPKKITIYSIQAFLFNALLGWLWNFQFHYSTVLSPKLEGKIFSVRFFLILFAIFSVLLFLIYNLHNYNLGKQELGKESTKNKPDKPDNKWLKFYYIVYSILSFIIGTLLFYHIWIPFHPELIK